MLARLVRVEGIGALPLPLAVEAKWRPKDTEVALDAAVRDQCAGLGWLDRRGRLDVDVVATLDVLCNGHTEITGWITTTGVVAAASGRRAVLAIRNADDVQIHEIHPDDLVNALVRLVPDVPAGNRQAVTVTQSEWNAPRTPGAVSVRPPSQELQRARDLVDLPRTGSGEFHPAVRDSVGRRRPGRQVSYIDTSAGRYLVDVTEEHTDCRITYTPASRHTLAVRLTS